REDRAGHGPEEAREAAPARRFERLERDVCEGELLGVEGAGRAEPVGLTFGSLREGYAGEDVATGAPTGKQDAPSPSGHVPLSDALAMLTSMPTPASVKSTEDPPALTNGSGMPLVGMAAVT